VDIYRLYAARNWAYQAAQEAALVGASRGRDWNNVSVTGMVGLDGETAIHEAQTIIEAEMNSRHITGFTTDVRALPEPTGGTIPDYPPQQVRLGTSRGDWSSNEPAVGIYLSMPVNWLLLDRFGIVNQSVAVFAAAGVAQ
jgi:hypothetical protein